MSVLALQQNPRFWGQTLYQSCSLLLRPKDPFCLVSSRHWYFPAQLVGGSSLNALLDKPPAVTGRCILFPPGYLLSFLWRIRRIRHSHCSSIFVELCLVALLSQHFCRRNKIQNNGPCMCGIKWATFEPYQNRQQGDSLPLWHIISEFLNHVAPRAYILFYIANLIFKTGSRAGKPPPPPPAYCSMESHAIYRVPWRWKPIMCLESI